jgi:hypothetical protein
VRLASILSDKSFAVKGKGREVVQDAPHNEPATPLKAPESWYDKFTHRPSAKGREKEGKESGSWLQAREVSSVCCCAL